MELLRGDVLGLHEFAEDFDPLAGTTVTTGTTATSVATASTLAWLLLLRLLRLFVLIKDSHHNEGAFARVADL